MTNTHFFVAAVVAGATIGGSLVFQSPPEARRQTALADFAARTQSYMDLRHLAALTVPEQAISADPGRIRWATDDLAAAIKTLRAGARQGDIFTPEIAAIVRTAIGAGCQDSYAELFAAVTEELDSPLAAPVVHGRWPVGVPVPTMPPDLLAELPWLPPGLQYRFVNRDVVLLDIDANLIVDLMPEAIPKATSATMARRP